MAEPVCQVNVRDFPADLWRRVRAAAIQRGLTLRAVLVLALTLWLEQEEA